MRYTAPHEARTDFPAECIVTLLAECHRDEEMLGIGAECTRLDMCRKSISEPVGIACRGVEKERTAGRRLVGEDMGTADGSHAFAREVAGIALPLGG